MLAPDPAALVVALLPRHRTLDPRDELPLMRAEINVAAHSREASAPTPAKVDEVLQLARMPMQPVSVIDDHGIDLAPLNRVQHPPVAAAAACRR